MNILQKPLIETISPGSADLYPELLSFSNTHTNHVYQTGELLITNTSCRDVESAKKFPSLLFASLQEPKLMFNQEEKRGWESSRLDYCISHPDLFLKEMRYCKCKK